MRKGPSFRRHGLGDRPVSDVYFCFADNRIDFNMLSGIDVYFCIPGRKGISSNIKGLSNKDVHFCALLHTPHGRRGQVLLEINALSATVA
jgi:hypothetical protein